MNKISLIMTEGILYGFLLSCFVCGIFDFKAEVEYYYHPEYHYKPSSFNFFPLVLSLVISSLLAKIIVGNFSKPETIFRYWLKIIAIIYVVFYFIVLSSEIYQIAFGNCESCRFPNSLSISANIEVLLLLLLLFGLFTAIYVYVKKILLKLF